MSPRPTSAPRFRFAPLVALLLLFLPLAGHAAPKLVVAQPVVDFGIAECGSAVTGRFEVRNEGDAPLELTLKTPPEVTLKRADRTLAPQATGTIEIEADTSRLSLELARFKLTLGSNDPEHKDTALELRGKLHFAVVPEPGYIRIVKPRGEIGALTITLTATDNAPFRILDATAANTPLEIERGTEPPAAQQRIVVRVPADAKIGPVVGWLDIRTDHPKRPVVRLPTSGFIRPAVFANPPELDFGDVPAGETISRKIVVKSLSAREVEFSPAECDSPAIALSQEGAPHRQETSVSVKLTAGGTRGAFSATIRVRTTNPAVPVVEIPVRANVR